MRFDYSDGDPDQEANFAILHKTACAVCLTESGFMDCKESPEFLFSEEGKDAIVQLHVEGIEAYVQSCAEDRTKFRINRDVCAGAFPARF